MSTFGVVEPSTPLTVPSAQVIRNPVSSPFRLAAFIQLPSVSAHWFPSVPCDNAHCIPRAAYRCADVAFKKHRAHSHSLSCQLHQGCPVIGHHSIKTGAPPVFSFTPGQVSIRLRQAWRRPSGYHFRTVVLKQKGGVPTSSWTGSRCADS